MEESEIGEIKEIRFQPRNRCEEEWRRIPDWLQLDMERERRNEEEQGLWS